LWKPSKPGEPGWPSPAGIKGLGRPGWHIECSAMADHWLWEEARSGLSEAGLAYPHQFDIHGGGIDLVFPHHENEIAQSRCAFHTGAMANYWMHNGFLQVEGEKMSKSVGNFVTIHELLADWPGEVVRLNMLRTHYRQPIDWTLSGLKESSELIDKWRHTIIDSSFSNAERSRKTEFKGRFLDALLDDLNTPLALAELHKLHDWARRFRNDNSHDALPRFAFALHILGFSSIAEADASTAQSLGFVEADRVKQLIDQRNAARKAKNFAESDRIRDELAAMGVVLKDSKDGTTWEIAR